MADEKAGEPSLMKVNGPELSWMLKVYENGRTKGGHKEKFQAEKTAFFILQISPVKNRA